LRLIVWLVFFFFERIVWLIERHS